MCWRLCEVEMPYENHYILSKAMKPKYWKFKDKDKLPKKYLDNLSTEYKVVGKSSYCQDNQGNRFIKNTKSLGKAKYWVLNGQSFYNAAIHPRTRASIALHYHQVFEYYIKQANLKIEIPIDKSLKISVDIYVENSGIMPDVDNLWPLEKWFQDSLVNLGIIPDDSPKYIRSSGEKTYIWVNREDQRKLVFKIDVI